MGKRLYGANSLKVRKRDNKVFDTLLAEDRPKLESFKVETPLGSLESDSGNHIVDVITIMGCIIVLYILKRLYYGGK